MKTKNKFDIITTLFMLFLIISMPISISCLQPEIEGNEVKTNSTLDFFSKIIKKTISFFDFIPSVLAAGDMGCCPETKTGSRFQTVLLEECSYDECLYPGQLNCWKRNETCPLGCCVSPSGMCIKNSFREGCPTGSFIANDNMCDQSELCNEGCCTVGIQTFISTNFTCLKKQGVWNPSITRESQCLSSLEQERMGCCKSFAGCEYLTRTECSTSRLGTFYADKKCTENEGIPGCSCKLNTTGKCVEGKPDLYYNDDCGNVYVKDEPQTRCPDGYCDLATSKCNSGSCKYTYQNNVDGKFTPKNTSRTMTNGASWCVYDTPMENNSPGTATSGSRYWRHYCLYGKDYVEPCADYRQQICFEGVSEEIPYAACVENYWGSCLSITNQEECAANDFCYWWAEVRNYTGLAGTNLADTTPGNKNGIDNWVIFGSLKEGNPQIPLCLPVYPPGLDDTSSEFSNKEEVCNIGSYICQYKQALWGLDTENRECVDEPMASELYTYMAHRCKSLGDCGTWFNWLGEQTNGFTVLEFDKKPDNSSNQTRAKTEMGLPKQYVEYLNFAKDVLNSQSSDLLNKWKDSTRKAHSMTGGVFTMIGLGLTIAAAVFWAGGGIGGAAGLGVLEATAAAAAAAAVGKTAVAATAIGVGGIIAGGLMVLAGGVMLYIGFKKGPGFEQGMYVTMGAALIATGAYIIIASLPGTAWNPFGWVTIGVAVVTLALTALIYYVSYDEKYYWVQCNPSTPPIGAEDCEKCNGDEMRPCSKYRCESLGTACEYKDTINISGKTFPLADGQCVPLQNTNRAPWITNISVYGRNNQKVFSKQNLVTSPVTIEIDSNGNDFPDGTSVLIDITLNTRAMCKWDLYPTLNFSGMNFPYESTVLKKELKQAFVVSRASPYVYVRCTDVYGNTNIREYLFSFRATTGPDLTPPTILATDRDYYKKFANGATQLPIFLYVDENATCRWSNQDTEYDLMGSTTECQTVLMEHGFRCATNLTGLQSDITNYFFFRCMDTTENKNVNHQSYTLELQSTPPIRIFNIIPENNSRVEGCSLNPKINLSLETEGGDNGNATCYWTLSPDYSRLQRFAQTSSNVHQTEATVYPNQINTVYIKCGDAALNDARATTTFTTYADLEKPIITRVFGGNELTIKTNEPAKCSFNFNFGKKMNSCAFSANDTLYSKEFNSEGLIHTTSWDSDPWYVKCYDECGNGVYDSSCTIIYPQELE